MSCGALQDAGIFSKSRDQDGCLCHLARRVSWRRRRDPDPRNRFLRSRGGEGGGMLRRGYGPQVSDEASSQWLGRMAIRRALWAFDGRIERTALAQNILDRFHGSPEEIVTFANRASASAFGELAPLVFDYAKRGDTIAIAIVGEAASDAERIITRLLDLGASSVYLHRWNLRASCRKASSCDPKALEEADER